MDLQSLLSILLGWAVHLSNYAMPEEPPALRFEPHSFFVEEVCAGKECNAVGWYNDRGIIYIDERYRDHDGGFATSLVVHEMIHYLQDLSGRFDSLSCTDSVAREREAYSVQNEFILKAQGSFDLIHPAPTACRYEVNRDVALTAFRNPDGAEPQRARERPFAP